MRIIACCVLAGYFGTWPVIDDAFLARTRTAAVQQVEPAPDWIGYAAQIGFSD